MNTKIKPEPFAQSGVILVSADHRASGSAKKGAHYMYRNLGKWEIDYAKVCEYIR